MILLTDTGENKMQVKDKIIVDDGSKFVTGQTILIEATGEYVYINSIDNNTLTVIQAEKIK